MAINKISRKDAFRIATWLEAHWEQMADDRPTRVEICNHLQKDLGLAIRPQSLTTICEAAGLNLEEVTPVKTPKQKSAALPTPDNKLAAQLWAVCEELRRLATWHNVKFDPDNTIDRAWLAAEAAK